MRVTTQYEERRRYVAQGDGAPMRLPSVHTAHVIMTFDPGEGPQRPRREYLEIVFSYARSEGGWVLDGCRITETWLRKDGERGARAMTLNIPLTRLIADREHLRDLAESVTPRVFPWLLR